MRKVLAILSTALMINASFAVDIDQKIKEVREDAYKSGYEKGYLEAITKEKEKWIKEGEDRIINRLTLYSDLLERIFNYKVLLKNGKILPPQVALVCDNPVKGENAIGTMNCEYRIVSNAKFIENPKQELSFDNLIVKGKIEELVKDTPSQDNIERDVYFVGVYDYEVGLDVIKRLYDAGYRTIQRNINGKIAIAVLPSPDVDLSRYKRMPIQNFLTMDVKEEKPQPVAQPTPVAPPPQEPKNKDVNNVKTGVIKADKVNLRTSVSKKGRVIGRLNKGDTVEIIEEGKEWIRVRAKGKEGYVKAKYVEVNR